MDIKLFASTFVAIFLAELGDKTQLAVLTLSAQSQGKGTRWVIFAASVLALAATSALGVLGGELVAKVASPVTMKRVAGVAFVLLGVWFVATAGRAD